MQSIENGTIINEGRFEIEEFLGGMFIWEKYIAKDNSKEDKKVFVKIEELDSSEFKLQQESEVVRKMNGQKGFQSFMWFGVDVDHRLLVTNLLGPSLQDLFEKCDNTFSVKTVMMIADQILSRLTNLHKHNIVHQDIHPSNLLMGTGKLRTLLYLTDFSSAKEYIIHDRHIPFAINRNMPGHPEFASRNAHYRYELSRRDDIENAIYILMHFLNQTLPWNLPDEENLNRNIDDVEKAAIRHQARLGTKVKILVQGLPWVFEHVLAQVRGTDFDEEPDYKLFRLLFRKQIELVDEKHDFIYDWTKFEEKHKPVLAPEEDKECE